MRNLSLHWARGLAKHDKKGLKAVSMFSEG